MKLHLAWFMCCSASLTLAAVVHVPESPHNALMLRQAQPETPPENTLNRTGQFPDGTWGCIIDPAEPDPYNPQKQCQEHCAGTVGSQEGVGPAIICLGVAYASGPNEGQLITTFDGKTLGRFVCGVPVLEYAVKELILWLPAIANIVCPQYRFDGYTSCWTSRCSNVGSGYGSFADVVCSARRR